MFSARHVLVLSVLLSSLIGFWRHGSAVGLLHEEGENGKSNKLVAEGGIEQFKGKLRLPKFAVPKHYEIRLRPDLVAFTFTGSVKIKVDVVFDTAYLVLNAVELNITRSSIYFLPVKSSESHVLIPIRVDMIEEDQILVLEFAKNLPLGTGVLAMDFEGILTDQLKGFYRSSNGENRTMAVTQFEAVDARRCFPCWDDPALKATFKMTLVVPSELMALSNTPVIEEKFYGDLKTVTFQETPKMSTYLVAVVVGLFDYVENYTADGVKVRVYCPVGQSNTGKFALDVAVSVLDFYREFLSIPFALPKMDLIGIPDFAYGGMENYGLVTLATSYVYYDDQNAPASQKESIASVIAHEFAHQWFGDLVTMEWWTHLWLNEGFATYLSYFTVRRLYMEFSLEVELEYLNSISQAATKDASVYSHPIEVMINQTSEILEIADEISYQKGAAMLQMLEQYIGTDVFQMSLTSYLRKYAWKNARTENFLDVVEEVSGKPVTHVMSLWTKQQGFPLVYVNASEKELKFEQTRFLSSGAHGDEQWNVPITFSCGKYEHFHQFVLQSKAASLDLETLPGCSCVESNSTMTSRNVNNREDNKACPWIKLNTDQTGFYRVKYDDELLNRLLLASEQNLIVNTDMFGILVDSEALAAARELSFTSLLNLLYTYREEDDYILVSRFLTTSKRVATIAADAVPKLVYCIKQFLISLVHKTAEKLGWDPILGESSPDTILRGNIIINLATLGDDLIITEATRRFRAYLNDRNTSLLPASIRQGAFTVVMQHVTSSNRSDYDSLLRIYNETVDEQLDISNALTSCPDPEIVHESLNFLSASKVKYAEIRGLLGASWEGRQVALTWLEVNWENLVKIYGLDYMSAVLNRVLPMFASFEKITEVKEFFSNSTVPPSAKTLDGGLDQVSTNAKWVQSIRNEKYLAEVLKNLTHGTC